MTPLHRAASALVLKEGGGHNFATLSPELQERAIESVKAVLEALKEPSHAMHDAAQVADAIMWSPAPREGLEGVDWDAAWRAMIDAAISDG